MEMFAGRSVSLIVRRGVNLRCAHGSTATNEAVVAHVEICQWPFLGRFLRAKKELFYHPEVRARIRRAEMACNSAANDNHLSSKEPVNTPETSL